MAGFWERWRRRRLSAHPFCTALVAAAGSSTRMGENKQLLLVGGVPVLIRSLQALCAAERVDEIVVAVRAEDLLTVAELCQSYGLTRGIKIVEGGASRAESVLCAAREASAQAELLAVHDGARPLVTPALIDRVIACAERSGAAAPAIAVKDTVKEAENGIVRRTPPRETLFAVQTPQVFDADLLRAALQAAVEQKLPITDDCSAVERLGKEVCLVEGEETNGKLTTPLDLLVAEAVLRQREEAL